MERDYQCPQSTESELQALAQFVRAITSRAQFAASPDPMTVCHVSLDVFAESLMVAAGFRWRFQNV